MLRIEMDPKSWRQGRTAGLVGGWPICPPDVPDRLAYVSGFIEGRAARVPRAATRRARRSRPPQRQAALIPALHLVPARAE